MMQVARVVSQARKLLEEKEKREGRRISYRKMEVETGISYTSISHWMTNNTTQFHEVQIVALCRYFNCDIGDLLKIDDSQ